MKAGDSGLIPLEVIKAKAALHVSDWDLEDLDDSMPPRRPPSPNDDDVDAILAEHEEGALLSDGKQTAGSTEQALALFQNSIAILRQDLVQDAPWAAR